MENINIFFRAFWLPSKINSYNALSHNHQDLHVVFMFIIYTHIIGEIRRYNFYHMRDYDKWSIAFMWLFDNNFTIISNQW